MGERIERGEPIARLHEVPHECRQRWRHPGIAAWDIAFLAVGQLDDGRWYVDHTREGCRAYPTEDHARTVAGNWMRRRGDGWEQVPCYPTTDWRVGERL